MSDKSLRSVDPVGLIALANVLRFYGNDQCSCELKCVCDNQCSCEMKCVCDHECSCEMKCVCDEKDGTNILDLLSNPVFRQVVRELDVARMRTIEDFMSIVADIRNRMNVSEKQDQSTSEGQPS